jgi:hypothetical protein
VITSYKLLILIRKKVAENIIQPFTKNYFTPKKRGREIVCSFTFSDYPKSG